MTRNTDLSTSTFLARKLTKNADDMVDEEKERSSDDLTITCDYSNYDILEEEKDTISENDDVWVKTKKRDMERKSTVNSLQQKKEDSEYLKIKWIDSRKYEKILIKNVSLNYSKKECRCPYNITLMDHTWRKQSMISPLK